MTAIVHGPSLLTTEDIWLFREGKHFRLYEKLGAHIVGTKSAEGRTHHTPCLMPAGSGCGVLFAVWAPNAKAVSVIGDFNDWNPDSHPLAVRWDGSGIWEGFVFSGSSGQQSEDAVCRVPGTALAGVRYKFRITTRDGRQFDKADPFAFYCETPPGTASRLWNLNYEWHDTEWLKHRGKSDWHHSPVSIYEVHAGSWRRKNGQSLTWRNLADELVPYVKEQGFTHVEFLPVMEHPYYGSWGYQTLGYFAPTARFGVPQDLMYLIDHLHQAGIGVILDWSPAHFPDDAHGLAWFDGTCLYEHEDPRQGRHPDWHSLIFNYGRNEVRSFLVSSALFWLDKYHADGLRVDAVASMLYLDYSRKPGEWVPNREGGRENLEAIEFIRTFNTIAYRYHPGIQTFAEESTAWPLVSRPVDSGGLGFGFKWNMGWMHDTLDYLSRDPVYRKYHHGRLTFSVLYAFAENFVLPLSHDEVVHGKGSLLAKMPGDEWQKFANLRLLLAYQYLHPGKKLLFMGGEFGQRQEWNHDAGLQWELFEHQPHRGVALLVRDLNRLYHVEPALYQLDNEPDGFRWVDCQDAAASVVSFLRRSQGSSELLAAANFTPVPRHDYRIGVPRAGAWQELLNTDAREYGGSGLGNLGRVESEPVPMHGFAQSVSLTLPPLAMVVFKPGPGADRRV